MQEDGLTAARQADALDDLGQDGGGGEQREVELAGGSLHGDEQAAALAGPVQAVEGPQVLRPAHLDRRHRPREQGGARQHREDRGDGAG